MEPERIPQLITGVEIGVDRGPDATVTVVVPPDRYFEVSPATARLLRTIDGRRSIEDLSRLLSADEARLTTTELDDLIDRTLVSRGLVHFGTPPAPAPGPRSRLRLRVVLLTDALVNRIVTPWVWLFRAPVALGLIAISLAAHAWFYATRPDLGAPLRIATLSSWAVSAALLTVATLLHEFGHAAALKSRGEHPGAIGFGVYWIWPVLFTDVSRAWKLERGARAVVDAGGMLVQLVVAAVLIAWWSRWPSPALARGITLVDLGLLANLNPLLRWDGYWLLVDLTGVRDLRRRSLEHARDLLRGRSSPGPAWITLYAGLSVAALVATAAWVVFVVAPRLLR